MDASGGARRGQWTGPARVGAWGHGCQRILQGRAARGTGRAGPLSPGHRRGATEVPHSVGFALGLSRYVRNLRTRLSAARDAQALSDGLDAERDAFHANQGPINSTSWGVSAEHASRVPGLTEHARRVHYERWRRGLMSQEQWSAVDRYITGLLVPPDSALDAALRDSAAAGLPAINVSPNQGKLL